MTDLKQYGYRFPFLCFIIQSNTLVITSQGIKVGVMGMWRHGSYNLYTNYVVQNILWEVRQSGMPNKLYT